MNVKIRELSNNITSGAKKNQAEEVASSQFARDKAGFLDLTKKLENAIAKIKVFFVGLLDEFNLVFANLNRVALYFGEALRVLHELYNGIIGKYIQSYSDLTYHELGSKLCLRVYGVANNYL